MGLKSMTTSSPFLSAGSTLSFWVRSSYFVQPGSKITLPLRTKDSKSPTETVISVREILQGSAQNTAMKRRNTVEYTWLSCSDRAPLAGILYVGVRAE